MRRSLIPCALLAIGLAPAGARQTSPGLPTGRAIKPVGVHTGVGSFPANMMRTPDGRFLVITNTGYRQQLTVVRTSDGRITDTLAVGDRSYLGRKEGLYWGLAFGPTTGGLTTLYASRGAEERVAVYSIDGEGHVRDTGRRLHAPVNASDPRLGNVVAGIALSADGRWLYTADNNTSAETGMRGSMTIVDARSGEPVGSVETGGFAFGIAATSGGKVYVTSERDSQVDVVDPRERRVVRTVRTGASPLAAILSPDQTRLYVANAGSDTVSVIDTRTDQVARTILLRPDAMRALPGCTPVNLALSPDGKRLYVALADMNALAVVSLPAGRVVGYVPTGWYPTAVATSADGGLLFITCAKGVHTQNPNARAAGPGGAWGTYIENILEGTVTMALTPKDAELTGLSRVALTQARVTAPRLPIANPGIKHVIYIVKENRTYDQVFGDIGRGNGDPSLCLFPQEVTPNLHALAERFVLMDNFHVCAEVSADGWNWSTAGMVSEYTARNAPYNYSGRGRVYDFEGQNNGAPVDTMGIPDVARPPAGYIWDQAIRSNVTLRNYGFFVNFDDPETRAKQGPRTRAPENRPNKQALIGRTNTDYRLYDTSYADSEAWVRHNTPAPGQTRKYGRFDAPSRFTAWKREFDQYVRSGRLPGLMLVRLGNDHTEGTRAGRPTPRAMVADNDYAVGQLVDAVSHSRFWKETAILILEDDAQNGHDHVDAHRSPALCISPYVRRATVDSRFYNTCSLLRTLEILLGMPPMHQLDAIATPFQCFGPEAANAEPYSAILPTRETMAERNRTSAWGAAQSARMNFRDPDSVPDALLNSILWRSVKGADTPEPAPRRAWGSASIGAARDR